MIIRQQHRQRSRTIDCPHLLVVASVLATVWLTACSGFYSRVPPNPPAIPLTSEQLAQYPSTVPYQPASDIYVHRTTTDIPPDAPGPKVPRYSQRETLYYTSADLGAILDYYREALPKQGWQYCRTDPGVVNSVAWYGRASDACLLSLPHLRVVIYMGQSYLHTVTIIESLPAPLEWPAS